MSRLSRALLVVTSLWLALLPQAAGAAPAPSPQQQVTQQQVTQMIVKYKQGMATLNAQGNARGEEELDEADRGLKLGDDLGFGYRVVKLPRATDEGKARDHARRLRLNAAVAWAEPDLPVYKTGSGTQVTPESWGLDRIDQTALPLGSNYSYNTSGAGVTAYIVDTGILASHLEFAGRVRSGFTSINDGRGTNDCEGHGTHVAGTVGGARFGVAKDVSLVAVRVLDCLGSGTTSGVIAGINWAIADHVSGPAVMNLSLGGGFSASMNAAIAAAVADGITVVVASGNSNADACLSSPASEPTAITVNASDRTDARATFSNFGTCTDIYAPGVSILSADAINSTSTATLSGTSMATPHVAGAAARVLETNPSLTPAEVWSALSSAATNYSTGIAGDAGKLLYLNPGVIADGAPSAPIWVTSTAGNLSATVNWRAPISSVGSSISAYAVRAFAAASGGTSIATCTPSPLTATTCSLSGLTNGTAYWVEVAATNATGEGSASNRVSVTPAAAPTAPGSPTGVTAAAGASGQAVVRWVVPTSNGGSAITSYQARAYAAASGGTAVRTCTATGATAVTCTITGLTNGTTYHVDVIATNAVGSSAASAPRVTVVPAGPVAPGSPTGVTAAAGASGQAVVRWVVPTSNGGSAITSYQARAYAAASGGTAVRTCTATGATAVTCTITGLTNGTTYHVDVIATNAVGSSAASAPRVTVVPTAPPTAPSAPTAVRTTAAVRSVVVNWSAPTNSGGSPVLSYTATAWSAARNGTVRGTCTATAPALTCTIHNLATGTNVFVSVTATNAIGTGTASARVTVRPL